MPKVGLRNSYRVPDEHSPALHHIIHHHCIAGTIRIYQAKRASRLKSVREGEEKSKGFVSREKLETVVLKYTKQQMHSWSLT
jgi:ATP sulfurylase